LAVIPSLDENLPNTVFECLQWGVNFIASNVGGIPELLDRATAQDRLFSPNYSALVAKIEDILTKPRPAAKLAFDPAAEKCGYVDWHSRLEVNRKVRSPEKPLVTICVVHFDRPQYLTQALSSINSQTYPNIEVVVVDDGSRTSEARQKLKSIATSRHRFPVKIVHTPDVGLGAARNAGVKQANGDFVLFMDDDNVAIPEMTERFVAAIQSSNSDVVTGLASIFEGDDFPTDQMMSHVFYLPLGGAINLGMFRNSYGDAHAIWKRSTLEALNGFIETRAPAEDWELFARACLKGYQVSVVPEQLHWRRVHKQSLSARPFSRWKQYIQIADTYAEYPPADLRPILRAGQFYLSFAKVKPEGPSQRGLPTVAKPRRRPLFLRILRRIALVILSWPIIANPLKRLVRAFMAELRS
jgi:glycosyltransferase involved in cell wall biosynthesis